MKKLLLILSILFLFTNKMLFAQKISSASSAFWRAIQFDEKLYLKDDYYKDKAFSFSVAVQINKRGTVDSVIFSEKSRLYLGLLINFEKVVQQLKEDKKSFLKNKGEYLVMPVFIMRGDSNTANNLDELDDLWKWMMEKGIEKESHGVKMIMLMPLFIKAFYKGIG